MPTALEVVAGRTTNPGATLTALTANSSNSFTVRDFPGPSGAQLQGIWAQNATAGVVRITSPRLHDDVQGIRLEVSAGITRNLLNDWEYQTLFPNDPLRFSLSGGGAETDSAAMLIYYPDLPGISANLKNWPEVKPRIVNLLTVEVGVVGPTTAGDWSGGTLINTTFDTLKADTPYAVLGYITNTASLAVALSSSDTGNLRVGGPGTTEPLETRDWFVSLNQDAGIPAIPVFNSNNRGSTNVFVAANATGGTHTVSLKLAQLSA
jgi:hypothetical protein